MDWKGLINMNFNRILIAYDGSETSVKALETAKEMLQQDPNTTVNIINIWSMQYLPHGIYDQQLEQNQIQLSEQLLEEAKEKLKEVAGQVEEAASLRGDHPASKIIQYATDKKCDLILIGSRGLGTVRSFVLGSVSYNVVQQSPIPVLVMK